MREELKSSSNLWTSNRRVFAKGVYHYIELIAPSEFTAKGAGVIRSSCSQFISQPVLIGKKPLPGEELLEAIYQFCVDYRRLNEATVPDRYPHARIDVLIRAVKGSRYLRALDLKSRS